MTKQPNYGQDRANRERAQAERNKEKLERRAEATAKRKAEDSGAVAAVIRTPYLDHPQ